MKRYLALSDHFRARFGRRVQKIPLDAGSGCPNRDGTLSNRGCAFCNPQGSGSGLSSQGFDIPAQWDHWTKRYTARHGGAPLFLAYLQSFSNTHGPLARLTSLLAALAPLPGLVGLAVGTRPDCLDRAKLAAIANFPADEIWLELGLQSARDDTLARINRGHTFADFARAVRLATEVGGGRIQICAHLMAGLPGETEADFLATVDALAGLPVHGAKLHNLLVCRSTEMARLWNAGEYVPLERDAYADMVARAVARLAPDVVVHRLAADPAPGELLAPAWAADRRGLRAALLARMEELDVVQGAAWTPPTGETARRPEDAG
jgi:radical SAM protein (TIGR01212 family)